MRELIGNAPVLDRSPVAAGGRRPERFGADVFTGPKTIAKVARLGSVTLPDSVGAPHESRSVFNPVDRREAPHEREIWFSLAGLTMDALGERQAKEIIPRLRPHWQNLASADRGLPPDEQMISHSFRAAKLAYKLTRDAGFDIRTSKIIALGAFLHDIGKGAIEDANATDLNKRFRYRHVLMSPDILTENEAKWMTSGHTRDGYRILLREVGMPEEIAEVARDHHSTRDPETSTLAQVTSTVDDADTVISNRPYDKARPISGLADDERLHKKLVLLDDPAYTQAFESWIAKGAAAEKAA